MRISASRRTSKHFTRNETRNERDLVTREISQRDARRPRRCPSLCAHRDTPVISNVLSRGVMLFGTGTEFGSRARVQMTMCAQRRDGSDVLSRFYCRVKSDILVTPRRASARSRVLPSRHPREAHEDKVMHMSVSRLDSHVASSSRRARECVIV